MLYRRFGYLQARILLDKQDELRRLEEELDSYDRSNPIYLHTTNIPEHQEGPRKRLLNKIESTLNAYGKLFLSRICTGH